MAMQPEVSENIVKVLLTILGGAISAITGLCLFFHKRKRDAKDSFLLFISMQRRSIDTRNFCGWHDNTKSEFRDAISKVDPFLSARQRTRMDALWREYEAISCEQLKQENEADYVQEIESLAKEPLTRKPSEILLDCLNRFQKVAE